MNTFPPERIVANSSPKTSPTQTVCSRARNQTLMCSSQSAVSSTKPGFEQKDDSTVPSASSSCLGTALPFKLPFFSCLPLWHVPSCATLLLRDPVSVSHPLAGTALLEVLAFSRVQSGTELSKSLYGTSRNTRHIETSIQEHKDVLKYPLLSFLTSVSSPVLSHVQIHEHAFEIICTIYIEKWDYLKGSDRTEPKTWSRLSPC